ncbi:MAG TPA: SCP2 sterol-binding domain-containing protein [Micromonosporaceae bacterium]
MLDPIERFFLSLEPRGEVPELRRVRGAIRFELRGATTTDRWLLGFRDGRMRVSRNVRQPADAVVVTDMESFRDAVEGKVHLWSLMLRGKLLVRGRRELATLLMARIFPGPADVQGPRLRGQEAHA